MLGYVKIHQEKVEEYAKEHERTMQSQHWLEVLCLPYDLERTIEFLLIYHTIGFCYWGEPKWTISHHGISYDGAIGMAYALRNAIEKNDKMLNWEYISNMSLEEMKVILKGNIEIPLVEERYHCLIEVAKVVKESMQGSFYEYIRQMNTDTELFQTIIKHFPSYEDSGMINGKTIYYAKRAQLLTSDILREKKRILHKKMDYSHLIGCADYKIPQVMRALGMIEYTKELADRIDQKIEIEKGSQYEMEIRSSMLVIIDQLKRKWNNQYTAIDINDGLWLVSQNNIALKPYHRTRTTAY